jgi:acyl carrier protein
MDKLDKIIAIAAGVLNVKKELLTGDTARAEMSEWDSLNHLRLVMTIEEQLKIVIPFEKVADVRLLKDFLNY